MPRFFGGVVFVASLAAVAVALTDEEKGIGAAARRPNIIWFLTDDQDALLGGSFPEHGGVGPMPRTKEALMNKGATAERFYV